MEYIKNPKWEEYYSELNRDERSSILNKLTGEGPDDGADSLRKELFSWRYTDPKKPGKPVDNGVWEMIIMPAYLRGFISFRGRVRRDIQKSLINLRITSENLSNPVLASAVYWELRNIAKRFYDACDSPKYARKFFGLTESSWEEKLLNMARDVWKMSEGVPERFGLVSEMELFSDAMKDEFFSISREAKQSYREIKEKNYGRKLPIVI